MRMTLFFAAAIVTVAGMATAQPPGSPPEGPPTPDRDVTRQEVIQRVDAHFSQLDANRDGRLTPEERRAAAERRRSEMADRTFARLDADNNGQISRDEMRDGRGPGHGPGDGMRGGPGGPGMDGAESPGRHGPGMREGRGMGMREVTLEEMRTRALARFDRADLNHDGTLTADERRQARDAMRERMRARREQDDS